MARLPRTSSIRRRRLRREAGASGAPTDILLSATSVQENIAAGTVVGTLSAVDAQGGTMTFELVSSTQGWFTVVGNEVRVATPPDYETATMDYLTIRVTDPEGNSFQKVIGIAIIDVAEGDTTPPVITVDNVSVAENTVLNLVLTANEPVTWSIIGGADAAKFTLSGNLLTLAAKDFEAPTDADLNNTYIVTVRATDAAGNSTDKTLTVTVTNVVEDPYWTSVVLLAGFDGTNGQTTYTEESTAARAATFFGDARLDTAVKKFGTASLKLDGNGDYVTFPDSDAFRLISTTGEEFTLDLTIVPDSVATPASTQYIIGQYNTATNQRGWAITVSGASIGFLYSTNGTSGTQLNVASLSELAVGQSYSVRIDYDGANLRSYVNGVMKAKAAFSQPLFNAATPLTIGARGDFAAGSFWPGHVEELRITKGVARTKSDAGYTPDSTAFPRA